MTQKQLSRFMLDLDEWDNEEDKRQASGADCNKIKGI